MSYLKMISQQIVSRRYIWTAIFILSALEGLIALVTVANQSSELGNRVFLGLSSNRLILLAVIVALTLLLIRLAFLSLRPVWRFKVDQQMNADSRLGKVLFLLLPIFALISLLLPIIFIGLFRGRGEYRYFAYVQGLLPLFIWGFLVSLQAWVGLIWIGGFHWSALKEQRPVLRVSLIISIFAILMAIFVFVTRIGITPDKIGWGGSAAPIFEWQACLAWISGSVFLYFLLHRLWPLRADAFLAVVIWLLAVSVWLSVPVLAGPFTPAGRPPNYEIYPFSDGAYYGLYAQNLLIGNGFMGQGIPAHPLYVTFLAIFHLIAGQKYEAVIIAQTLLLALLPVILYFIGRELHSRPAGLVMALFAIFREWTADQATQFSYLGSSSKLFFGDLPTALIICLLVLLVILWLKAPTHRTTLPLLVGGTLGLAVLVRTQSLILLPVLLILSSFALRGRWRLWLVAAVLVISGFVLAVAPWLWRNAQITGRLIFEDPNSQIRVLASRYSFEPANLRFLQKPGESMSELTTRASREVVDFTLAHPGYVAFFIGDHWINAEINSLQILPLRAGLVDWKEIFIPMVPFWEASDGRLSVLQVCLLILYLGLVIFGIATAWVRLKWAGMVPLLVILSYNAGSAISRFSSGRYLLPVDWAVYVYIAIALMEITGSVFVLLGTPPASLSSLLIPNRPTEQASSTPWNWRALVICGIVILFMGSLPLMAEKLIPRRYPIQSKTELISELYQPKQLIDSSLNLEKLDSFLLNPDTQVIKGRALYPRYYAGGDGEPNTNKTGYELLPYSRTIFLIASNGYNGLIQLKAEDPPSYLPNAADVIVVGCQGENTIDAQLILIPGNPGGLAITGSGIPTQCPVSPP